MNKFLLIIIATSFFTVASVAQKIPLPPFLKWHTNNSPDCKNVILTKDSMVLPVKNKCRTEGQLENWRPGVDLSDGIPLKIPANAKVQLTITYKFIPVGDDMFIFSSQFSSSTDNSDEQINGTFRTVEDNERVLHPSIGYTTKTLLMNFSEMSNPVFKAPKAISGELVFDFGVSYNPHSDSSDKISNGQTHTGSKAVIKSVVLEVIK